MKHNFAEAPSANINRSAFDRTHKHLTTFDEGQLIPVYVDEVLPGDTFKVRMTSFMRLATPIHPTMDTMKLDVHFFFVPLRQVWDNFRKFCGEQVDPGDSIDYTIPICSGASSLANGTNGDYMGLPLNLVLDTTEVSALPFRCLRHIWNEWYRDQNIQDSLAFNTGDGPDNQGATGVHAAPYRRGKRHDYFTACLTQLQKGDAVELPLGTVAPVQGIGTLDGQAPTAASTTVDETGGNTVTYAASWPGSGAGFVQIEEDPNNAGFPGVYADLTNAAAATITQLRQTIAVQQFLERDARGGTRYAELVLSHFGVRFFDVTYRPEYLGGSSSRVQISAIAKTSEDGSDPQGNLAAMGTVVIDGAGFTKSFTEHGYVFGIASARCDLTYQQGLPRHFSRQTRYDFFWPEFAHISEQPVLKKEIYSDGTATDDEVFGYQERHAEYRYFPNRISGQFRSDVGTSLDSWHYAEDFASHPSLNSDFIEQESPVDRTIAVPTEPHLIGDFRVQIMSVRPMPMYGVPGLTRL